MPSGSSSRRDFLRTLGVGAAALAGSDWLPRAQAAGPGNGAPIQLSEHLFVYPGPVQVGILRDGPRALLIDCGDGRVAEALPTLGIQAVAQILFTHHHRDQACGAARLVDQGATLHVPVGEKAYFDDVASYWNDPKQRWDLYQFRPQRRMLTESVRVEGTLAEGQELAWGPAKIQALATPGHTDGSLSYLVEVDGRRVVFCGDVLCGEGHIWDLYSLQKALHWPGGGTSDYHGFLGARGELVASLGRLGQLSAELLVPSHGPLLHEPAKAIEALVRRLAECHDKYAAISAARHYSPKAFAEYEGRTDHMPIRPGMQPPACLRHFSTSWILVSESGAALVMDCGSTRLIDKLQEYRKAGEIGTVEGLWITHYHDDHTAAIADFQKVFDCPCLTDDSVAEVITRPTAWQLPCLAQPPARVDRRPRDGESWPWHEFTLTAYHFPGQTLYHAGLLAVRGDLRMLFVGDSFTPGGIDDYCAYNRNWLGKGVGFDRCLELIEELRPTHLFNCHVGKAFDFTPEQCRFMRQNLAEREQLFGQLVPWDHANYGMDPSWARAFPYEQTAHAGDDVKLEVLLSNHSTQAQRAACRAVPPRAWRSEPTDWSSGEIAPKQDGSLALSLRLPGALAPGRHVVAIDLRYGPWDLPQFTEAVVVVG